jgi:hypothetical protein
MIFLKILFHLRRTIVAYYPFDGNANDESGNGNDGTEHGGLNYAEGKIGQAASFNGINNYIEVFHNPELSLTEWSISAWVNPTSMSTVFLVAKQENNRGRYNYGVVLRADSVSAQYETAASDFDHTIYGRNGVAENRWFHVTQTRSSSGEHRIYVNATLGESGTWNDEPVQNNEVLIMGRNFSLNQAYYQGSLDEVRIHNLAAGNSRWFQMLH